MDNNSAITELENVERDLTEKLKNVKGTLAMLRSLYGGGGINGNGSVVSDKFHDYNKNLSFREKVQYIFKKENRFLHVREIAEIFHSLEPRTSIKEALGKLSPAIGYLKSQGAIVKIKIGKSNLNTFWGSKNWVDSNGNPKEQHKYDENQLNQSRKGEEIII